MKRIGIFGGSFNPIHYGHIIAAQTVGVELKLDKVYFVPCCEPPHKTERELAFAKDRLAMIKLAIEKNPFFGVSDFEIKRGGKSYSINTVKHFRAKYPKAELFLIVGADTAQHLHEWKDVADIIKIARFVAVNRPGYKPRPKHAVEYMPIVIPEMEISSSFIRDCRHQGKSIWYLTHEGVVDYIYKKNLYKN